MLHLVNRFMPFKMCQTRYAPIVEHAVMQPILIDRSQFIFERLVQKFYDFCITPHCHFLSVLCAYINAILDGREAENGRKPTFFRTLLLSGCSCGADNVSREREALAAFWLTPKARIHVIRTFRGTTHRSAQVFFLDGITDANDHGLTPMKSSYR
jgi:hypothetical protein